MTKGIPANAEPDRILNQENQIIDEDHDVIRNVLDGDTNSYRRLVEKYQGPVFNLLIKMVNNFEDAEELTQDVFVKAFESLAGFNFKYRFFSWIYKIAINRALAELKYKTRYTEIEHVQNKLSEEDTDEPDSIAQVKMAIGNLKELYKAVIILKYYEGLSYKEIAVVLDIPEKKVRSRLYDARMKMKEALEKSGTR